jgi:hypothetical protein
MFADTISTTCCGRHITDEQRVGNENLTNGCGRPQAQPDAGRSKNATTGHELRCSRGTTQKKN